MTEINGQTTVECEVSCPECGHHFEHTEDNVEVTIEVDLSDFASDNGWRD